MLQITQRRTGWAGIPAQARRSLPASTALPLKSLFPVPELRVSSGARAGAVEALARSTGTPVPSQCDHSPASACFASSGSHLQPSLEAAFELLEPFAQAEG